MRRTALAKAGWLATLSTGLLAALLAGGCAGTAPQARDEQAALGHRPAATGAPAAPSPSSIRPRISAPPLGPLIGRAPTQSYPVGIRTLALQNGPDRPLPTTVYYPASGRAGGTPRTNAAPASGRFPVVLFSHGLNGRPAGYQTLLSKWAAAGFVVAAPAYPHTSTGVPKFDILDVVRQPADASQVLSGVLALDTAEDDPLHGHLDANAVGAAGHSAGGITTVGLFTGARDPRLRAGVVLAGNALGVGDAFAGPPASLLFVHGGKDDLVSYASGKATYDKVPWAKAMFSLPQDGHGDPYLRPSDPAFPAVTSVTTDFLRWSLYGDPGARQRMSRDTNDVGTLDNRL